MGEGRGGDEAVSPARGPPIPPTHIQSFSVSTHLLRQPGKGSQRPDGQAAEGDELGDAIALSVASASRRPVRRRGRGEGAESASGVQGEAAG